jgi:hypothetical protein
LGWIAWDVGLLVDLGVRMAGNEVGGWVPGIVAVAIAVLSILCGKELARSLTGGIVRGLSVSPDGKKCPSAGMDGSLLLWELPAGEYLSPLNWSP